MVQSGRSRASFLLTALFALVAMMGVSSMLAPSAEADAPPVLAPAPWESTTGSTNIPPTDDPGWTPCGPGQVCEDPDTIVPFSPTPVPACQPAPGMVFAQSTVTMPSNVTVTTFAVDMQGSGAGATVTLFNAAHPGGTAIAVVSGEEGSTWDLQPFAVAGLNRVVVAQPQNCLRFTAIRIEGAIGNAPPDARDDSATTLEAAPVTVDVLANDTDPEGDALTVTAVTQGAHGAVAIVGNQTQYSPAANWSGTDTFTYTVSDGHGGTDTATVTVTVTHVNHPPVANDDAATTDEDVPVTIDVVANDSDPDGDALTVTAVTQGAHGAVAIVGNQAKYSPASNWSGTDTFTYTISDGHGGTDTATVTVTVTHVNHPPVANDDAATTDEDVPVTVDVVANDSDPDGDALTMTAVTQGAHGSVAIAGNQAKYTPAAGWSGTDTFTYTIGDGHGGSDTATVTVTVRAVNAPPVAKDDAATTDSGVAVTVLVLANDTDPDGDTLTITSVTQGANGTVVINAGVSVTYTPTLGFAGTDTFRYTISDGNGGTASATVTITVRPAVTNTRMTGGGVIEGGKGKDAPKWTWGFEVRCDMSKGNFEYQDHTGGNFHLTGLTSVVCFDDSAVGSGVPKAAFDTMRMTGTGRWNGVDGYTIEATIVDAGEPGTSDSIVVTVKSASGGVVSTVTGKLTGGNHQAHK